MGYIGDWWDDARLTVSQRKSWEIWTAIVCIFLALSSVAMCFIFTLVAPPGGLESVYDRNEADAAGAVNVHRRARAINGLYIRAVETEQEESPDFYRKPSGGDPAKDALACAQVGSNVLQRGGKPTEAAKAMISCFELVNVNPDQDGFAVLVIQLAAALSTGNTQAAADVLQNSIPSFVLQ